MSENARRCSEEGCGVATDRTCDHCEKPVCEEHEVEVWRGNECVGMHSECHYDWLRAED